MTHITIEKAKLEQWLEALWTTANPKAEEAITAIKAALAQPAPLPYMHSQWQEMIAGIPVTFESEADAKRFLAAQPAQEPVAWMREDATLIFAEGKVFAVGQPFYTTPQQRPWVGLTHDERYECIHGESVDAWDIAEAVEAKLKEKNA
jgi:hypothetical protein